MIMFTRSFWSQAAERALKTAAQAALALLTLDAAAPASLLTVDWAGIGSAAALAALASVLTSLVSASAGPAGSPSLVDVAPAAAGDMGGREVTADDFPSASLTPSRVADPGEPVALLHADRPLDPAMVQRIVDEWLAKYAPRSSSRHALREDHE